MSNAAKKIPHGSPSADWSSERFLGFWGMPCKASKNATAFWRLLGNLPPLKFSDWTNRLLCGMFRVTSSNWSSWLLKVQLNSTPSTPSSFAKGKFCLPAAVARRIRSRHMAHHSKGRPALVSSILSGNLATSWGKLSLLFASALATALNMNSDTTGSIIMRLAVRGVLIVLTAFTKMLSAIRDRASLFCVVFSPKMAG